MIYLNSFILLLFLLPACINGACPNKCSGHGVCSVNDKCVCEQNWTGGDCCQRVCPFTRAWVDSSNPNDAHYYAECGNKGSCDRSTGICNCDPGYTGSGCRRQSCPNDCSGHGTCEFIEDFGSSWVDWDKEKIMGCSCDPGFEGHDCSSRMCPRGDDPLTNDATDTSQQVIIIGADSNGSDKPDGNFYLIYNDPYGNSWTTSTITASVSVCADIKTALSKIPNHALTNIDVVSESTNYNKVSSGAVAPNTAVNDYEYACKISFPNEPGVTGFQNLLRCDYSQNKKGSQPYNPSSTGSDPITACTVFEISSSTTTLPAYKELSTCSNRGICDGSTGECQCFTGHRGLACQNQEALY